MPRGQARFACGVLATFALVTVAAGLAAWHKYQLLAGPLAPGPYVDNPLVEGDTYFRNLMGWRTGLLLVALLQFSVWLAGMRDLADVIWRQGQRRHRAWLVFGWVIPLGQLFMPKMFINDLWGCQPAGTAASSRTSPAHGMVAVRPRRGECIQRCPRGTEEGGHHEPGSPGPASDHVQRWPDVPSPANSVPVLLATYARSISGQLKDHQKRIESSGDLPGLSAEG
ncbi:hypothetical protein ABID95_002163 [Streptomyces atratus]